jgi:lipopolysaccharide transport system permease protein/teichoic acid transport system permease protein
MVLRQFLRQMVTHRAMVCAMARQQMRLRYAGTLAGLLWSVVHPLMMVLIYWFVFAFGLKVRVAGGAPFILVFLCGLAPWTAFAETVSASTRAVTGSPHLVRRTRFPTEILPVVHLTASMLSHAIMLAILAVLLAAYGVRPSVYCAQFVYFLLGLSVLGVGLGWMVSALNVLFRDVGQIVAVLLNLWFWLTPVVWQPASFPDFPPKYLVLLKANPMYYVVQGYRASFLEGVGFWRDWPTGLYFWAVSLVAFVGGAAVFGRLKGDFAEVL